MSSFAFDASKIKRPNVSGQFYESDPKRLAADIDQYFAQSTNAPSEKNVEILIAPHAGYMYSGGIAAYSYKAISQKSYKTVVILAPSHFVEYDGISVWEEGGFQTPLGTVEVDSEFAKKIIQADDKFYFLPQAFTPEHSLEVEIPFLQKTLDRFMIVPIIMGQPSYATLERFAETLRAVIGNRKDVLIVVSTDFSHYHAGDFAREMDSRTIEAVAGLKAEEVWKECRLRSMEMCGYVPVTAALIYARLKGLHDVEVLRYAHSGDVTGENDRVVGYASIVIFGDNEGHKTGNHGAKESSSKLTIDQKRKLIGIARTTIEEYVRHGKKPVVDVNDERLTVKEGAFVTIHKRGRLRGCIGNIIGTKPLYLTVRDMAVAAATEDPRFPPVTVGELDSLDVEVSVLSEPRAIKSVDEIQLGVHGVIVSQGPIKSGVFLPQVADETGWSKEEFLSELCAQKAGLPADAWKDPATTIKIFTADVFDERDVE